jgi:hypothetical protein
LFGKFPRPYRTHELAISKVRFYEIKLTANSCIALSSSTNAVSFSSVRTMKRFPSPRCASVIKIESSPRSRHWSSAQIGNGLIRDKTSLLIPKFNKSAQLFIGVHNETLLTRQLHPSRRNRCKSGANPDRAVSGCVFRCAICRLLGRSGRGHKNALSPYRRQLPA